MKHLHKKELIDGIVVAIFATFTLTVFAPYEMYATNVGDFWFDLWDILPGFATVSAVMFAALLIINTVTSLIPKVNRYFLGIEMMVTLLLYFSGNFMSIYVGELNGESINWELYSAEGMASQIGLIGLVLVVLLLIYRFTWEKFMPVARVVMVCICLVQLITMVTVSVDGRVFGSKTGYYATNVGHNEYSSGRNMNILVLDSFDARVFDDIMNEEEELIAAGKKCENRTCKEILSDFTFYKNNAGMFTLTDFAIPQIITGEKYLNQEDYGPFVEKAYFDSPLLNTLHDDGWETNIYTTVTLPQDGAREWINNWKQVDFEASNMMGLTECFYELLAFRYLPYSYKPMFEYSSDYLNVYQKAVGDEVNAEYVPRRSAASKEQNSITKDANALAGEPDAIDLSGGLVENEVFCWKNDVFYKTIPAMHVTKDKPVMHFYHIKGLHAKRDMDINMQVHDNKNLYSYNETAYACMKIIDAWLTQLKEIGVYDNSSIIIMADHGMSGYRMGGEMQSPLLLIKGVDEHHDFSVDERAVSYADLQPVYLNLLSGAKSDAVFESENHERFLYSTDYIGALKSYSRNEPFYEYSIGEDAFDVTQIRRTGRVFE